MTLLIDQATTSLLQQEVPYGSGILASSIFSIAVGFAVFLYAQRRTNEQARGRRALVRGADWGALIGVLFPLCLCTILVMLQKHYFGGTKTSETTGARLAVYLYTPAIVPALSFGFLNTVYLFTAIKLFRSFFDSFWAGVFSCISMQLGLWIGLGFVLFQRHGSSAFANGINNEDCTYMGLVVALGFVPVLLFETVLRKQPFHVERQRGFVRTIATSQC